MSLLFLIPLVIGLVAARSSRRCTDDLAELTGFVAALSLILSLVLAPWQILFLLLTLIISTKTFQRQRPIT